VTSAPGWLRQWASRLKWKAVQSIAPDYRDQDIEKQQIKEQGQHEEPVIWYRGFEIIVRRAALNHDEANRT